MSKSNRIALKFFLFITIFLLASCSAQSFEKSYPNSPNIFELLSIYLLYFCLTSALFYFPAKHNSYFKDIKTKCYFLNLSFPIAYQIDLYLPEQIAYCQFITLMIIVIYIVKSTLRYFRLQNSKSNTNSGISPKSEKNNEISNNALKIFYEKFTVPVFMYLSSICDILISIGDSVSEMVNNQLLDIYNNTHLWNSDSILSHYLKGHICEPPKNSKLAQPLFPFGFNISQRDATKKALINKISVIQGPPGTGKTQTILNIISNAILNNQTVAVVSNNNTATNNVLEKLAKYDLSFIAAPLGSYDNKQSFFEEKQTGYPNINTWRLSKLHIKFLKKYMLIQGYILDFLLHIQNRKALLMQQYSAIKTEENYFNEFYEQQDDASVLSNIFKFARSSSILNLIVFLDLRAENNRKANLYIKIKYFILVGVPFNFYKQNNNHAILKKFYYKKRIHEINRKITLYDFLLKGFSFNKTTRKHTETAMRLLKGALASKYIYKKRRTFSFTNYKRNFPQFIDEYPIIMSSTYSIRSCCPRKYMFDYVIIDEASQVDITTGMLAFSCAKQTVIVGDLMQLPHIIDNKILPQIIDLTKVSNFENTPYDYRKSILQSVCDLFPNLPKTMLKEHYRCDPKIIEFCSKRFYNNELIVLSSSSTAAPLKLYKTSPGNHQRKLTNQRQIEIIFDEIIPENHIAPDVESVGIIAPFRSQVNKIMGQNTAAKFEIDTIHKFQGREKDIIIFSTVSNKDNDFISNSNLLNVAISRAIKQLFIIVASDDSFFNGNSGLSDFVKYIQYNNFQIAESKIYSVFDLLYSNYSKKLEKFQQRIINVSAYKSENILNTLITETLTSNKAYMHLGKVLHVPLRMIIKDVSLLTEDEYRFMANPHTHLDFLVYNTVTKIPVLAIEVDGYEFHANNPIQLERDKMKDTILHKYDIDILRLPTTGSREGKQIIERLDMLLSNS